ncbi:hypothetical protein CVD28_00525 [Bacillus sp. M6-12]|uniref:hypothetical protein n=1 Tax=Bacillus sp. M6-12 TaxID=2054166 RepID=UPI000C759881|nr:hypothetical protein [Bacillus sp. M6-12]PLS18919.1 hypothetical protein CVD28_00525 [Bacillus sp. M6-12]
MKSYLLIYEDRIEFEPTDSIENLIYFQRNHHLLEVGLNVKVSSDLSNKESVILDYIQTSLFMKDEIVDEFLSFLSLDYKTVGMFMKLSEGRHPADCLRNLYMKYCREYQKKTLSVYDYLQVYKRVKGGQIEQLDEDVILSDYIKEVEIHYERESTLVQFKCESIWIDGEGVEVSGEEVSLFLDEKRMKKAFLTFLNPCLIEKND